MEVNSQLQLNSFKYSLVQKCSMSVQSIFANFSVKIIDENRLYLFIKYFMENENKLEKTLIF